MLTKTAIYFVLGLASSLALTPICRAVAQRLGLTAKPKEDRWHKRPTALFGGLAIAIPTLALGATLPIGEVWQLLVCGTAIAAFGFADDLFSLKPSTKLIVQITLASMLLFFGYRLQWTDSLIGDTMLTLFWIVGITNAFNLLDNMDGLCAGTAIVAGSFSLFGLVGDGTVSAASPYLAALLGSTAGFLVYNFHPATIFMGDTGSLFLGLNIAAVTLIARSHGATNSGLLSAMAVPVLLLLVPILDTTLVTLVRLMSGRKPSQGGRDHTSHRLVAIGLSQRTAVAVLWLLAAAGGGVAITLQRFDASLGAILTIGLLLASIIFAVYLARIRVYEDAHFRRMHEGNVTPIVVEFMHKRRVAEVLLDLCLTTLAYYTAYHLRFDAVGLLDNYPYFLKSLPVVVAAQIVALFVVGGYRGNWHQFGMMDAVVFAKGVFLGMVGAQIGLLYAYRFESYSRAVFIIYGAILLLVLCGSRASFRLLGEFAQRRRVVGQRCVVYGTGSASLATIREAFGDLPLRFVGFIDDDPRQRRMRVSGYPVLGNFDRLLNMIDSDGLDCVVLNTRIFDVDRLNELEAVCQRRGVSLLRLQINVKPFVAVS
jgi:UDP-GlcNAc:undecaprenyl-phosphate GlcNAc-1-phosphate transferase